MQFFNIFGAVPNRRTKATELTNTRLEASKEEQANILSAKP